MSCNGCRILRKGCSEDCVLKPCLQWIKSPDSQANATLFLAKFYGRAGLVNLITAGPNHLRPEIFRSLLYEACGRIINPVFGSVGLMVLGNWSSCQAAVEAVLKGKPIMELSTDNNVVGEQSIMPLQSSNIRHISSENTICRSRTRKRLKRSGPNEKSPIDIEGEFIDESTKFSITGWDCNQNSELERASSHDSFSVETVEPSLVNRQESMNHRSGGRDEDVLLRLTLGMN